ncbi:MAG TPA: ABC transporter permease, partial [Solirubrobacterales bacterium]|nr:ABC transporter permease [Solirubrobacterales bacterium]
MARYILSRVMWGVATAFAASLAVFLIFHVMPTADPAVLRAGRSASPDEIDRIRDAMGLDEPIFVQYWLYLKGLVLHFDLGYSYAYRAPVNEVIGARLPATAYLVIGSAVLWLVVGIPIGVISALRRGSVADRATMVAALVLISAPVFWLGLVALYLFAQDTGVLWPRLPGVGAYAEAGSAWG